MGGINTKNVNINDIVEFKKLIVEFDHLRDSGRTIEDIHSILMSKNDGNDKRWTRSNGRLERKDTCNDVQSIAKVTKKQQLSNKTVQERKKISLEIIQPMYSYLTVVDRVNVSRTSNNYKNALKRSEYWQEIVINFNEYDKKFGYPLNVWALLMQRKASFKSLVITIGSGESEIIESLVSNCNVTEIEVFKMYVIEDLNYLTCYHHSAIVDLLSDNLPRPMSTESKLKTFFPSYDSSRNKAVIPLLAKSENLRDVRLVIGQPGEADVIRTLRNVTSLTVSVIATAQRNDEDLLYLIGVLLKSIESLPRLTLLELKDNIQTQSGRVQIMSKTLSVKSETLKTLIVRFGKLTRIYDIICPSLELMDINSDLHFGNIYLYEDFQEELIYHEALSKEQQKIASYSLLYDMKGRIVIENPGELQNCKFVGVYYDRRNRISYFNYIHLPKNCVHSIQNNNYMYY